LSPCKVTGQHQIAELRSRKPTSHKAGQRRPTLIALAVWLVLVDLSLDFYLYLLQSLQSLPAVWIGCKKVSFYATDQCLLDICTQTNAVISNARMRRSYCFYL